MQGRGFWILIGAANLAAVFVYALVVLPMKKDIETRGKYIDRDMRKVIETRRKGGIVRDDDVRILRKRKEELDKLLEGIRKEIHAEQKHDYETIWEKRELPKPKDLALFSSWYREQSNKICAEASGICNAKLHPPPQLTKFRDDPRIRRNILRRLTIVREVHRVLAKARANVTDIDASGNLKSVRRRVERVRKFDIEDLKPPSGTNKPKYSPEASGALPRSHMVDVRDPIPFTVEFLAHPNVVLEVLRDLGKVKDLLIIVRRLDMSRAPETVGLKTPGGNLGLRNKPGREPPARVILECQAVEYVLKKGR